MEQFFNEARKLIAIIRSAVNNQQKSDLLIGDQKELELVYQYARRNNLQTFVDYYAMNNSINPEAFFDDLLQSLAFLEWQNCVAERITNMLAGNHIRHILVKGETLRRYYPERWMRLSSDIDILIPFADKKKAIECIEEKCGYGIINGKIVGEPGEIYIDIKTTLGVPNHFYYVKTVYEKVWENTIKEGSGRLVLNDEMEYFNTIVHALKHLENGGCGLAHILDIWILNHMKDEAKTNQDRRNKLLIEAEIKKAEEVLVGISEEWFSGVPCNNKYSELEKYIINGSAFGNNRNKAMAIQSEKGKIGFAINQVFVPYKYLKQLFPQIEGKHWLLPIYEVYRWLYHIKKSGLKGIVRHFHEAFSYDRKEVDLVQKMMKQLFED